MQRLFDSESSKNTFCKERMDTLISNLEAKQGLEATPNQFESFKVNIDLKLHFGRRGNHIKFMKFLPPLYFDRDGQGWVTLVRTDWTCDILLRCQDAVYQVSFRCPPPLAR